MHGPDVQALIERDGEVAVLRDALTDASAGCGSVIMIDGPAGLGKSRLLDAARDEALAQGRRCPSRRPA